MYWLVASLGFLLFAGFCKLSTWILNFMLARPQPKWMIGLTELIQLSLIPIYACLLYRELHIAGLFSSVQSGTNLTPLAWGLIAVGAIGLLLLIRSTITYQTYRPPQCQIGDESQQIDLRRRFGSTSWKHTLVGPRPMRRLALLPGNDQFTIEVSTKTYMLPRLPRDWDGLSIVQFADTHFRGAVTRQFFEEVCDQAVALKPDIFVFTGDLLDDQQLLEWLPSTFGRLKAPLGQYFVLGNHDWYQDPNAIRREFERFGWVDLASRSIPITAPGKTSSILIAGDETPWMGTHPTISDDRFCVLLSHTPDNISWARDHHIDLMLAGHTHGGQIRLPLFGPVYSPSSFGCRFASGVFWLEPTLLYVSRGISGREPIRYQCVPELVKLVLKSPDAPL